MKPMTSSEVTGPVIRPVGDTLVVRLAVAARQVGMATGILSVLLGAAMVVWPEVTVGAVAGLFGLQLMIHGVYRIVLAIVADEADGAARVLFTVLGVLSFCIGVLALRHLLQTVTVMALLFGLFWVIGGIIELVAVLGDRSRPGRGWAAGLAILSVVAGTVVLVYPEISLVALTWLFGVWLITWGLLTVGGYVWIRHLDKAETRAIR